MSWLESLTSKIKSAVAPVLQSPPARMAGRALQSTYTRPMIGFKPEIAGIIASELLPKENAGKQLLDAALYLASGPLNMSLGLAGSTPQGDDPYSRWKQLGYTSREDMVSRVAAQQARDRAGQVPNKMPGVYIADDYGPPRPVRYQDGGLMIGDYEVKRFDTQAARELAAGQPQRNVPIPAAERPVEERRAPVTRRIPATANPPNAEDTRIALEQEMLAKAAKAQRTDNLLRQLTDIGATKGMTEENARLWVAENADLAERLIADRAGREQRLAKEFEGFSAYM